MTGPRPRPMARGAQLQPRRRRVPRVDDRRSGDDVMQHPGAGHPGECLRTWSRNRKLNGSASVRMTPGARWHRCRHPSPPACRTAPCRGIAANEIAARTSRNTPTLTHVCGEGGEGGKRDAKPVHFLCRLSRMTTGASEGEASPATVIALRWAVAPEEPPSGAVYAGPAASGPAPLGYQS
jgi:hypothetical protein